MTVGFPAWDTRQIMERERNPVLRKLGTLVLVTQHKKRPVGPPGSGRMGRWMQRLGSNAPEVRIHK